MISREFNRTLDGRLNALLQRIPSHRPLPDDQHETVEAMTIEERERLIFSIEAIEDNLEAHLKEIKKYKTIAMKKPGLKVL